MRYVPPKRRLTKYLNGATSQKTAFFKFTLPLSFTSLFYVLPALSLLGNIAQEMPRRIAYSIIVISMTNFTHKPDNACRYTCAGNVGTIQVNIALGRVDITLHRNIERHAV
jgi:hypothetical protein